MRILQIDDDKLCRMAFADLLRDQRPGHDLVQVGTLEEVVPVLEQQRFDLIILDACVPGEVFNTDMLIIGLRRCNREQKMVGVSGDPANLPKMLQAGCNQVFSKKDLWSGSTIGEIVDWAGEHP